MPWGAKKEKNIKKPPPPSPPPCLSMKPLPAPQPASSSSSNDDDNNNNNNNNNSNEFQLKRLCGRNDLKGTACWGLAWSKGDKYLAAASYTNIAICDAQSENFEQIKCFDVPTGGGSHERRACNFSPAGDVFVYEKKLGILSVVKVGGKWKEVCSLKTGVKSATTVAFSPEKLDRLVTLNRDQKVKVYKVSDLRAAAEKEEEKSTEVSPLLTIDFSQFTYAEHTERYVEFPPQTLTAACPQVKANNFLLAGNHLHLLDVETGERVESGIVPSSASITEESGNYFFQASFAHRHDFIIAGPNCQGDEFNGIFVYVASTLTPVQRVCHEGECIKSLRFSNSDQFVCCGDNSYNLSLWKVNLGSYSSFGEMKACGGSSSSEEEEEEEEKQKQQQGGGAFMKKIASTRAGENYILTVEWSQNNHKIACGVGYGGNPSVTIFSTPIKIFGAARLKVFKVAEKGNVENRIVQVLQEIWNVKFLVCMFVTE